MADPLDFATVYDRWMPQLTRYCRGITHSDADAEDAAQNAMVKAMAALRSGPAPDQMKPWLHRIARNEAVSLLRRRGTGVAAVPTDGLPDRGGPTLEEVAAVRGRLQEVLADVRALGPRQREALMLRELEGRSYREIAAALAVTEEAAQQAVFDARRSLRECDAGRALACEPVQRWLSAHEHAHLRTRRVRAHLRGCPGCRGFQAALDTRPRGLRLLLLPGGPGAGLLGRLLGLLGVGGGAGGGGSAVALKALVGASLLAGAGWVAAGPGLPGSSAPAPVPAVRAPAPAVTTAFVRAGAAPRHVGAPAGLRTTRHAPAARGGRRADGHRLVAVRVPGRPVPAAPRPLVAPVPAAGPVSAPAPASAHTSPSAGPAAPAPVAPPVLPAAAVPATAVTPAITLPAVDPAPVVQAVGAAAQSAVATGTAPVAAAVHGVLP